MKGNLAAELASRGSHQARANLSKNEQAARLRPLIYGMPDWR
jgi:hypothetical protein